MLLAQRETETVFRRLAERAHRAAMRLLQGDGLLDGISVNDGAVTLNLLPLVGRGADPAPGPRALQGPRDPGAHGGRRSGGADRRARGGDSVGIYRTISGSSSSIRATTSPTRRLRCAAPRTRPPSPSGRCGSSSCCLSCCWSPQYWSPPIAGGRSSCLGLGVIAAIVVMRRRGRARRCGSAGHRPEARRPGRDQGDGGWCRNELDAAGGVRLAARPRCRPRGHGDPAVAAGGHHPRRWRRRRRRVVVILLGLSIWTLLVGLVLAVAVVLVTPRLLRPASTVQVEGSTPAE